MTSAATRRATPRTPKVAQPSAPRAPSQPLDLAPAPRSKEPYRSRESIRQIETVALRKVRHALYERGLDLGDLM